MIRIMNKFTFSIVIYYLHTPMLEEKRKYFNDFLLKDVCQINLQFLFIIYVVNNLNPFPNFWCFIFFIFHFVIDELFEKYIQTCIMINFRYFICFCSLKQTLHEGKKDSNVDIQLMLANVQRCQKIVRQLLPREQNQFYNVYHIQIVLLISRPKTG